MHKERDTSWHFVMSIVKYRESHFVRVLDMYLSLEMNSAVPLVPKIPREIQFKWKALFMPIVEFSLHSSRNVLRAVKFLSSISELNICCCPSSHRDASSDTRPKEIVVYIELPKLVSYMHFSCHVLYLYSLVMLFGCLSLGFCCPSGVGHFGETVIIKLQESLLSPRHILTYCRVNRSCLFKKWKHYWPNRLTQYCTQLNSVQFVICNTICQTLHKEDYNEHWLTCCSLTFVTWYCLSQWTRRMAVRSLIKANGGWSSLCLSYDHRCQTFRNERSVFISFFYFVAFP